MKNIILVVTTLAFIGCNQAQPTPKEKPQEIKKVQVVKKTYPSWIDNPNINGEDGVVGVIKLMKNKKKQEYIATRLAIALYQEQKRVSVNTTVKTGEVVAAGNVVKSTSSQTTTQTSSHFQVEQLVKKAEYSDKENYYVWMVVKK